MTEIVENPHVALNNARNLPRRSASTVRLRENDPTSPRVHFDFPFPPANQPEFKVQLDVSGKSEALVTEYCIAHLRERGYYVAAPNEKWESAGAFCKRVGANKSALHTLIARYQARGGRPPELDRRGKSQRVTAIRSHEGFDTFCRSLCRDSRKPS